ncbi:MAG TPA: hypothetical protein ENK63_00025 [Rhodobacterales bacterium]|nr:hypothetical protein [Rhodobacterales bacterium]
MFKRFLRKQDGAVTVDFVVLTSAIVGLGGAVLTSTSGGVTDLASDVVSYLGDVDVNGSASGPTYGQVLMGSGYGTGGGCSLTMVNGQAVQSCGQPSFTLNELYAMSDGTQWWKETVTTGGVSTVTWTDQDGNVVDAPEATPT